MVSVIVVNFNGENLIGGCVRSLESQTLDDFELIIVDNGSGDASLQTIETLLSSSPIRNRTKVIPEVVNRGFAEGNGQGIKHASGEYIALLNNDTEPHEKWLAELVAAMDEDPEIGICASKLISSYDGAIDSAGDGYTRALRGFKRGEGDSPEKFDRKEPVFGACAGAALYRRTMLDEIGFLDDDFFLINEDTDLNLRAKLAGWKCVFVPTAVVLHKVTSSIKYLSRMHVYYTLRNGDLVRIKNIPLVVFMVCLPEYLVGLLSEFLFFAIKHRRMGLFFEAKKDAIKLLPRMLEKRRTIMAGRKVSNRVLLNEMTPVWDRGFLKKKVKRMLSG